jgi:hypothetical protein
MFYAFNLAVEEDVGFFITAKFGSCNPKDVSLVIEGGEAGQYVSNFHLLASNLNFTFGIDFPSFVNVYPTGKADSNSLLIQLRY